MNRHGYCLLVPEQDELTVAQVAEQLQVSEDTVRALIRNRQLPAVQRRARGAYYIKEADVQAVKDSRAHGLIAGPSTIDPVGLAELVAEDLRARMLRAQTAATEARRNDRARKIRATTGAGYGAVTDMADALGLHRTVVQRWLKVETDLDELADLEAREAAAVEAHNAAVKAVSEARARQRVDDDTVADD